MSEDGPYLFDVGVIALAHAETPVSGKALTYIRRAIKGDIDAIVPVTAVFGAHVVLTRYYGYRNEDASALLDNLLDAERIRWYTELPEPMTRNALETAGALNLDAWDAYYGEIARAEAFETLVTIDEDFERFDGFETEIILSAEEFATLEGFLQSQ